MGVRPSSTCLVGAPAAFLILVAGSLASAQAPPDPSAPAQPRFQTGTHIVEVDATVQDDEGRFVDDLTIDDFELLEDGVPQPIQTFYLVTSGAPGSGAETLSRAPQRIVGGRRFFIFLFDVGHLSPAGLARARTAVDDFLATEFGASDVGGVVAGGQVINGRLTSDRAELRTALQSVTPSSEARSRQLDLRTSPRLRSEDEALRIERRERDALEQAVDRACAQDPGACGGRSRGAGRNLIEAELRQKAARLVTELRLEAAQTLRTIAAVSNGLARLPGRKVVTFLSEGFLAGLLLTELQQVVGHAARAGVRIYSIDVRGLRRVQADVIDAVRVTGSVGETIMTDELSDGMNSLAVDTGGFLVRNQNNLLKALSDVARDASAYYVLGYEPTNGVLDGTFRRIEVKVRRDGLRIRARRGYLATAPPTRLTTDPPAATRADETPLAPDVALAAPEPATPSTPAEPDADAEALELAPVADEATAPPSAVVVRPDSEERILALSRGASASPAAPEASDELVGVVSSSAQARLGWERYQRGDVEGAKAALMLAVRDPDSPPWVHYALGQTEFALGRHREAAKQWNDVRRAAPAFNPVYFDLADAYLQLGEADEAIAALRDAEERWPDDTEVLNAIGVIQVTSDALDEAIDMFEKAVEIAPEEGLGYFNLGRALEARYLRAVNRARSARLRVVNQKDRERAIDAYERYLEIGGAFENLARDAVQALSWR